MNYCIILYNKIDFKIYNMTDIFIETDVCVEKIYILLKWNEQKRMI